MTSTRRERNRPLLSHLTSAWRRRSKYNTTFPHSVLNGVDSGDSRMKKVGGHCGAK